MAKMPDIKGEMKSTVTSADIINAVTYSAGIQRVTGVAENDLASIRAVGEAILNWEPNLNAFIPTLLNRIIATWVTSKRYRNPWSLFKKGMFELGDTIEEIFVGIASVQQYNVELTEQREAKRTKPNVLTAYHVLNYQAQYPVTIEYDTLKQAFVSLNGVRDMVANIVESLYTADAYDEFNAMKYILARAILDGRTYPVQIPEVTADNSNAITTIIKGVSNAMTFMNNKYTYAGNQSYTNKEDQILIVSSQWDAVFAVESLASAFNLEYRQFSGQYVLVDSFGNLDTARLNKIFEGNMGYRELSQDEMDTLNAVPAVTVDRDFFMVFDNLFKFTEKYFGSGLYWNYWLNAWKYMSTSPFVNAVSYVTDTPTVTSVTVTPATAKVGSGEVISLSAKVATTNFASARVNWTCDSDYADVTDTGLVTVHKGTPSATSIVVTATSDFDNTKKAICTITVA